MYYTHIHTCHTDVTYCHIGVTCHVGVTVLYLFFFLKGQRNFLKSYVDPTILYHLRTVLNILQRSDFGGDRYYTLIRYCLMTSHIVRRTLIMSPKFDVYSWYVKTFVFSEWNKLWYTLKSRQDGSSTRQGLNIHSINTYDSKQDSLSPRI